MSIRFHFAEVFALAALSALGREPSPALSDLTARLEKASLDRDVGVP